MRNRLKLLCAGALLALLCACGSSNTPVSPRTTHNEAQRAPAAPSGNAAEALERDTVAAVSPGGSDPPIGLRFRLESKPVVGTPAQLVLALIPTPGVEISHIHGSIQGDGLQLESGRTFDLDSPQNAPIEQDVTIIPLRNGVLSVSATLQVDYDSGSLSRTYVIPVIAANAAS